MNPFKPTAGKTPPYLIGRDEILSDFAEGLRNGSGAPERLVRVAGVRGMGKTVILNEFSRMASEAGWIVVDETASDGLCDRILERLLPATRVTSVHAEPSVFGVTLGRAEIERVAVDLRSALVAQAVGNGERGVLITVDEVQDASISEMRQLATAVQHVIREDGNIAFAFAGLPSMIDSVVNGKTLTFLRRAVPFDLDMIQVDDVAWSFEEVFSQSEIDVSDGVVFEMAQATWGYPFMVQLVGYYCWQAAERGDLKLNEQALAAGLEKARSRFDATVIEPILQRLSAGQLAYLFAMAQDDRGVSAVGDIAKRLGKEQTSLSAVRAALIKEGVIESLRRGEVSFVVPGLEAYLRTNRDSLLLS